MRHSPASSTGVLPVFTTCFGPRTAAAAPASASLPASTGLAIDLPPAILT